MKRHRTPKPCSMSTQKQKMTRSTLSSSASATPPAVDRSAETQPAHKFVQACSHAHRRMYGRTSKPTDATDMLYRIFDCVSAKKKGSHRTVGLVWCGCGLLPSPPCGVVRFGCGLWWFPPFPPCGVVWVGWFRPACLDLLGVFGKPMLMMILMMMMTMIMIIIITIILVCLWLVVGYFLPLCLLTIIALLTVGARSL